MRVDLHTHSIHSDGELIPAELVRRAMVLEHDAIAITDHVDMTNLEQVVASVVKAEELESEYIRVIPGVEITHVPPSMIDSVAKRAKELGAKWVVVHGETLSEPVMPGTNAAAVRSKYVDLLAHPGFITEKDAKEAADNGIYLEISGRAGHSLSNGHVVKMAKRVGAKLIVNSDTHAPDNLMDENAAMAVAIGAGLDYEEAETAVKITPFEILKKF